MLLPIKILFKFVYNNMVQMCQSHTMDNETSTVCKEASLRKVKTNRNKYFVLHSESSSTPARLEYYNSRKHWDNRVKPRKTIYMKACFSINPFSDSRTKSGITLFTNDETFQIGFDSECERDTWLHKMRSFLWDSTSPRSRTPGFEHTWSVHVATKRMRFPIAGEFKLSISDKQVALSKHEDSDIRVVLPFEVIREYGHKEDDFVLDVGRLADTGAGELWMTLDDTLIAQNVYDVMDQNMNVYSSRPTKAAFRPPSKSFSHNENRSVRPNRATGSSKSSSRHYGVTPGQVSPFNMFASITRLNRESSESIDSHSTASISTEELSCSCSNHGSSRSTTPDPRNDSQNSSYMNVSKNFACLHGNRSSSSLNSSNDHAYTDMSCSKEDPNSNFMYIDMTCGKQVSEPNGYVDMSYGNGKDNRPRPHKVKSFVICDEGPAKNNSDRRHYSLGARPLEANSVNATEQYVEMCRQNTQHPNSGVPPEFFCKCCHKRNGKDDIFAELDDDRHRASSFTSSQRPRNMSWSQFLRPRSSSHGHKIKPQKGLVRPHGIEYVDMTMNSPSYIEMSPLHKKENVSDKENKYPPSRSSSRGYISRQEPFPELSASDDNVSLQSVEGSSSIKSNTSSLDNMSTTSCTSQQSSSAYCSSLDSEPYVTVHPPKNPVYVRTNIKPTRVASFIIDDTQGKPAQTTDVNCACPLPKHPK